MVAGSERKQCRPGACLVMEEQCSSMLELARQLILIFLYPAVSPLFIISISKSSIESNIAKDVSSFRGRNTVPVR